jgi:hypothetical protein
MPIVTGMRFTVEDVGRQINTYKVTYFVQIFRLKHNVTIMKYVYFNFMRRAEGRGTHICRIPRVWIKTVTMNKFWVHLLYYYSGEAFSCVGL